MLQKIEPILTNSSEKFFTNSQSKEIKDKIHEFIKETNKSWAAKTIEFDVEKNFLNKLHKAQAIELRI